MEIDIYQSITKPGKFLAVRAGLAPAVLALTDRDFANLALFRSGFRFDRKASYKGADAALIARQVESDGFAMYRRRSTRSSSAARK